MYQIKCFTFDIYVFYLKRGMAQFSINGYYLKTESRYYHSRKFLGGFFCSEKQGNLRDEIYTDFN